MNNKNKLPLLTLVKRNVLQKLKKESKKKNYLRETSFINSLRLHGQIKVFRTEQNWN